MKDFWKNILRYPSYLISVILGVLFSFASPLLPLFKRPSTAIALSGLILASFAFLFFTLRAMLGLDAA